MSSEAPQFSTTLSLAEIEALIRRVVREAVHEEFARVLRRPSPSVTEDWAHEGPEDPDGDQELLAEALALREQLQSYPDQWMDWDAFKAELDAAGAGGELSD